MNLLNSSVTFLTSVIEIVENKNPKTLEGQCVVCISRDNPDVLETRVSMLLCEVWYAENSIYKTNISQFAFRESLVSCRCGSTRAPFVNKTFDGLVCVGFVAFSWFPYALN